MKEDKFSQSIYGTAKDSQCKNCIYNYNYAYCTYYGKEINKNIIMGDTKCMAKTTDDKK